MDKFFDKGMMGSYLVYRNSAGAGNHGMIQHVIMEMKISLGHFVNHVLFLSGHSVSQVGGHDLFMDKISPINGYNGPFGFRRNTPWLRKQPSVFEGQNSCLFMPLYSQLSLSGHSPKLTPLCRARQQIWPLPNFACHSLTELSPRRTADTFFKILVWKTSHSILTTCVLSFTGKIDSRSVVPWHTLKDRLPYHKCTPIHPCRRAGLPNGITQLLTLVATQLTYKPYSCFIVCWGTQETLQTHGACMWFSSWI